MPDDAPVMTAVPLLSFVLIVLFLDSLRFGSATMMPSAKWLGFQLVAYTTFRDVGICHYLVNGGGENYFCGRPARLFAGKE